MKKIKLGIIGTSDIAFRRFLPSLKKSDKFEYVGVASRNIEKTKEFIETYGGKGFGSYNEIVQNKDIDALYIPLPPALHFKWAKKGIENGKHILLEKPFTTNSDDTKFLISLANEKKIALQENYMFQFHSQLKFIENLIKEKSIGDLRLIRIEFGFPMRKNSDFRYNKDLGGGALLDCGGYTVKLATHLLGETTKLKTSKLNFIEGFDVDIYGSAVLENKAGTVAQISFGMDNYYKCETEIWGSKGYIIAPRIFTAPSDFKPQVIYKAENEEKIFELEADDQFLNSIEYFYECIKNEGIRKTSYKELIQQSELIDKIQN